MLPKSSAAPVSRRSPQGTTSSLRETPRTSTHRGSPPPHLGKLKGCDRPHHPRHRSFHHTRPKVGFVSLGCPKNLVDSEVMMGMLHDNGAELTPDAEDAEIIVINTCSFIDSAKQESVNTILEMVQHKTEGRAKKHHRRRLPGRALPRRDPQKYSRGRRRRRHRRTRRHPRRRRPHPNWPHPRHSEPIQHPHHHTGCPTLSDSFTVGKGAVRSATGSQPHPRRPHTALHRSPPPARPRYPYQHHRG